MRSLVTSVSPGVVASIVSTCAEAVRSAASSSPVTVRLMSLLVPVLIDPTRTSPASVSAANSRSSSASVTT